jgi:hypothetical protein
MENVKAVLFHRVVSGNNNINAEKGQQCRKKLFEMCSSLRALKLIDV